MLEPRLAHSGRNIASLVPAWRVANLPHALLYGGDQVSRQASEDLAREVGGDRGAGGAFGFGVATEAEAAATDE
jgi:hypothetical protein